MQLRFSLLFLNLLCGAAIIGVIGWLEGWPIAVRLVLPVLACLAVLGLLQWLAVGRAFKVRDQERELQQQRQQAQEQDQQQARRPENVKPRMKPVNARSEPQLEAQPAPESVAELASESAPLPATQPVDLPDPESKTAANNSRVTVLDLKHKVSDHVAAIRSMGKSINQRAQDPAFTQASELIVNSADRIDTALEEVLARNDGAAQDAVLSDALRAYIDQCKQRADQTRFTLRLAPNIDSVSAAVAEAIDLIVKGAVENAIEHAGASHIESNLRRVNEELEVQVADNGVGLPKAGLAGVNGGLQAMRDRAIALGGSFDVGKSRLGGVVVRARIPALAMPERQVVNG
jgi:signal transduction histidine kinase